MCLLSGARTVVLAASDRTAMAPDEEEVAAGSAAEEGLTCQRCNMGKMLTQRIFLWVLLQHETCDSHGPAMGIVMAVGYGHIDGAV